jgi:ABC-2 type transport system permease protein
MSRDSFIGTTRLIVLALKRDRVKLTVWILGIALMLFGMGSTYTNMLTEDSLAEMITVRAESPAVRAFDAPASGGSLGAFTMLRVSPFVAILIAIMSIQTIVRHTRQNEENGQSELIGSTAVGRFASLTASLVIAVSANIILAVLSALALLVNGLPAMGSFTAGAAFGATGIAFAGVAAITAQLSQSSRGANAYGGIGIGIAFLLTSIGNMLGEFNADTLVVESAWPTWISPFGWYQQMRSYDENNLWILILFLLFFISTISIAFVLCSHRDVGMGIFPARRGSSQASSGLKNPFGFAFILQRGTFLGWLIAMLVFGTVFGSVSSEFGKAVSDVEGADKIFGDVSTAEVFLVQMVGILGSFAVIYMVQSLMRMRGEEVSGTMEPVLSTSIGRIKWMASHVVCYILCTAVILFFLGFGAGLASTGADGAKVSKTIEAAMLQLPSILVLAGLSIALFGLLPRWSTALSWIGLALSLIAGPMFGPMLDLPKEVMNISPYSHIPMNISEVTAGPVVILIIIALGLTTIGFISFKRRNYSI